VLRVVKKSGAFWVYFLSSLVSKLIPFLMLPILTKYLSVADYGVLTLFQTILAFLVPITSMSLSRQVDKYFFQQEKPFIARLLFQIIVIFHGMSLVALVSVWGANWWLGFGFDTLWLYLLVGIALSNSINLLFSILLRNLKRVYLFGLFQILQTLLNVGVSLLFIVQYAYGYEGRFLGIATASYLPSILAVGVLYRTSWISLQLDIPLLKKIWRLSLPMVPFGLATIIITMSDVFFIKAMCSVEMVGLYAIGLLFGKTIILIQSSVTNVSEPWVLRQLAQHSPKADIRIVKFIGLYHVGILLLVAIGSYLSSFAIVWMIDEKFHEAKGFVFWIMLAYGIRGLQGMYTPFLIAKDKMGFMALNTVLVALLNIVLNYILILSYGTIGAAYATLITFGVSYLSVLYYTQKVSPLPFGAVYREIRHTKRSTP